jgi:SAM-dependent methyltransferase
MLARKDLRAFLRVHFLAAAFESGLLAALATPSSPVDLASRLGVKRTELLASMLEIGRLLGELSFRDGRYALRGTRSRALAAPAGDPLAAFIQESVGYHGSVYRHLAARLQGAESGDYLTGSGTLIARSSRILEPYVGRFAEGAARSERPRRLLEVGCGSGVYLRHAAAANQHLSGVAIDMQEDVVAHARENLASWGLAERFDVKVGNILAPHAEWRARFDLVTLYNNIYYFPLESRVELFRSIRSLLAAGGALAMVSIMHGPSLDSLNFDLLLRSTRGCAPLPKLAELITQLREGGFPGVRLSRLIPGEWLYGVLARPA